jgi:hypothetical protein
MKRDLNWHKSPNGCKQCVQLAPGKWQYCAEAILLAEQEHSEEAKALFNDEDPQDK